MVVRALLNASAVVDQANASGATALTFAAGGGHKVVVEVLLDAGAALVRVRLSPGSCAKRSAALTGLCEAVLLED